MKSFPKICQHSNCIHHIENFLRGLYICESSTETRCITWIELYILYRICGNDKPLAAQTNSIGDRAKQAIPLDLQFKHFKNHVRIVSDCALSGGIDAQRFKPADVKDENLINVGLEGRQPAVGFNVSINDHTQKQMTKALILLGRDLSTAKLEQFFQEDDPTHHKAGPFCFKGQAGWDTRLATYAGSLEQLNTAFNQDGDMPSAVATRLMYVVQCPRCERQSPSNDYKFQYEDLGLKIKCTECSKCSCIAKWTRQQLGQRQV